MTDPISGAPSGSDPNFEWYKQEHETLSKHFEEAWKSGALNFSYAAIVSAALLTFGSTRLQLGVAVLFSAIPMVVWLALAHFVYSPYVEHVGARLKTIEIKMNELCEVGRGHFDMWYDGRDNNKMPAITKIGSIFIIIWLFLGLLLLPVSFNLRAITDAIVLPRTPTEVQLVNSNNKPGIRLLVGEDVENSSKNFQDIETHIAALQQRIEVMESEFKVSSNTAHLKTAKGKENRKQKTRTP
jgi:hypothetical protein